ncbi:MAG: CaiB/BaiF CoA-transferase family protein [Paracoccaceae bacterium]|nr:CaiB/BaiF CoA-transferase family protein [Paracoccaceae bacterium]
MSAPLEGLRVLELARVLAGPWAGQLLADLGAEVIKVEAPAGDDTRAWGPPFVEKESDRSAAYFYGTNRGKSSVVADLRSPDDLLKVKALAAEADVIIENFKLGGLAKFGLDYEKLREANPGVVYCSITGFGQTGPRADEPGYDLLIQAMSGVMDITGAADGPPMKMGVAFADIFSGLYAGIGIQAALAERQVSGVGQHIDISLFDCMTGVLANQAQNLFATGKSPKRKGNAHPNLTPYEAFEAADGHIVIAVGNDGQFRALAGVLERPELAGDPDFATNKARLAHRDTLHDRLQAAIGAWGREDLFKALKRAGVPAGPINDLHAALTDPQLQAREMVIAPDGDQGLRTPLVFSRSTLKIEKGVPALGETPLAAAEWSTR